jgi:RNA polymerase sigma-70 factor (ECF subfamily)
MAVSEHDADEIFQDCWLRVIRKADGYRRDRFRGWVYRIAHNLMIDHVRRRKSTLSMDVPAGGDGLTLADSLPAPNRSPSDDALGNELAVRIRQAVDRLAPEQREVFLLRTEGEVPFREIARIQRVPVNTALARMQYALQKLRVILHDDRTTGKGRP